MLREGKETRLGHKSSSGRTGAGTFFLEVIIICMIVKVKDIFFGGGGGCPSQLTGSWFPDQGLNPGLQQ